MQYVLLFSDLILGSPKHSLLPTFPRLRLLCKAHPAPSMRRVDDSQADACANNPPASVSNRGTKRNQPFMRSEELSAQIEEFQPKHGGAGLWWLTQASWFVKFPSCSVVIDPWWRDLFAGDMWAKLIGEFPLAPEEYPAPDYVFCTHWHDDHICPETLPRMAKAFANTKFIIPSRSVDLLLSWGIEAERIISSNGHRQQSIGPLSFKAIPAAHMELDFDEDGCSWYVGYVLECDGVSLYHMGDGKPWPGWHTAITKAVNSLSAKEGSRSNEGESAQLDIALLCINGNDNLSHIEAVDLITVVKPKVAIPMHYGMDPDNTVDPLIYHKELSKRLPDFPCTIPQVGRALFFENGDLTISNEPSLIQEGE